MKPEVSQKLVELVPSTPALKATLEDLATRERDRSVLSVEALTQRLKAFSREEVAEALHHMAGAGIGRVVHAKNGKITALINIQDNLKEIGQEMREKMRSMLPPTSGRNPTLEAATEPVERRKPRTPRPWQTPGSKLIITVLVNNKPVNIPVPDGFKANDLADLLERFL